MSACLCACLPVSLTPSPCPAINLVVYLLLPRSFTSSSSLYLLPSSLPLSKTATKERAGAVLLDHGCLRLLFELVMVTPDRDLVGPHLGLDGLDGGLRDFTTGPVRK